MSAGLLALALLAPAAPPHAAPGGGVPSAGLAKGDELTFVGTVEESVERPGTRFRRAQNLEVRVLVLEKQDAWADVAVLTLLRRKGDAVASAVGTVTGGAAADKPAPPAARLDLLRVHADGSVHHLHPAGPPPLALDAKTPGRALPPVALDAFSPFEFGMFPPRAPRGAPDQPWTVASTDPARPEEVWQAQGTDFVTAGRCGLLVMNQQHPNWARPVGGRGAWHRADAVWVSAADGAARKVHRVIKHRDGLAADLAAWVEVKYELKEKTGVIGRTFDRYRADVETAFAALADLAPFLADPVRHGPKFFDARAAKLDAYLEKSDASSPYREAVLAVRRQVEAARKGESVLSAPVPVSRKAPGWPAPGQPAPNVTAGPFTLSEHRGKPVLLVFFKPGSETTDLALAIADALREKYGAQVSVAPLAVWADVSLGVKDRDRCKLTVPVYDGAQAEAAYGVGSVPRFALIDGAGVVKWTFCGVGSETGYSAKLHLERLLAPAAPNGAAATTRAPAPGTGLPAAPP
ncbi:MAG: TlpA family protein disulfide reductase [Gemmata sp.]